MVAQGVDMKASIEIPADQARVLVEIPSGSTINEEEGKYMVNDVVIAFM